MAKTLTIKNLQLRNDTAANWASVNPVLAKAEMGIETDTKKFKFGDGISTWNELGYASAEQIEIDDVLSDTSVNPVQNKVVNEAVHYTNETATVSALGGIAAGTTFDNMSIQDILTKLLYPYIKPTASVSVTPNGGTYERGTSVTVTALKVNATKKSSAIASVVAKNGATTLATVTEGVANGGSFNCLPEEGITLTSNTTFTGVVTDVDGGSASANSTTFTFIDPYYYGVVADGTTITSDILKSLSKDVKTKGNKTYSYTCAGECPVIAYPASYGALKSIMDPNNFENVAAFTQSSVTVETLGGNVEYYVYVKTASTITNFAFTFKY